VLGGLLQDSYTGNAEKVPGLSSVPLVGNLFKSESRARTKTNLMVFLHPVVVRDAQATDQLSMDRYDLMRSGQKNNQPQANSMVPIDEAPQLPAPPAKPGKQNLLGTDTLPEPAAK